MPMCNFSSGLHSMVHVRLCLKLQGQGSSLPILNWGQVLYKLPKDLFEDGSVLKTIFILRKSLH